MFVLEGILKNIRNLHDCGQIYLYMAPKKLRGVQESFSANLVHHTPFLVTTM